MSAPEIVIRECTSVEDFQQCIDLERTVWNDADIGIMPIRLYMISKACNAPTFGAFLAAGETAGKLVGFVHTMIAIVNKQIIYHSHLAAVLEAWRHQDIGYSLKLAQRGHAINAGVPLVIWTFDPLQSRNAHFNINKLGAIIRRYAVNYYGEGLSTVFDAAVPSDRLFAEWWVSSPHAESALAGNRPRVPQAPEMEDKSHSVSIPDDIEKVRAQSLEEHQRWRTRVRGDFQNELAGGLIARGFEREGGTGRYLFGPDEPQFHFKD